MTSMMGVEAERTVTVSLSDGSEFDFELLETGGALILRRLAERWANRRLPLNADATRQIASVVAEQKLIRRGLI